MQYETSVNSPSVNVVYTFNPTTSAYISYVEGLESGGTAPNSQQEIGFRSQLTENLLASASEFNMTRASASSNSDGIYSLNGKERYLEAKYSFQGQLSDKLSLVTTAMWLDAEVTESTTSELIGNSPQNTPSKTASLLMKYELLPSLSINVGAYSIDKRPVNAKNQAYIPGYTTYTAGVVYNTELANTKMTIALNIENLSNKEYWSAAGNGQMAVGLARTGKLSMASNL